MSKNLILLIALTVIGCNNVSTRLAPVVELKWQSLKGKSQIHTVRAGETLYSIAFRYDKDYKQLAELNHLQAPYKLSIGEKISLNERSPNKTVENKSNQFSKIPWFWPAKGKIVTFFRPAQGKKGIDIAGKRGDKIFAASQGIVAYAGNGLAGYGNLIIIKHRNHFLTAYGHNSRIRVTEGQIVKAGQVIADMGTIGKRFWGVHFEIRKFGKPINPMLYVQRNST